MAFFSKKEVVVGSPMEGVLSYKGKPASGAQLRRHLRWKDETGVTDTVVADQNGHFSLPAVTDSWRPLLPAEFVAHQKVYVEYQGEEYLIWTMGKMDESLYGELGGKPNDLICEITGELARVEVDHGMLGTVCRWSSIDR